MTVAQYQAWKSLMKFNSRNTQNHPGKENLIVFAAGKGAPTEETTPAPEETTPAPEENAPTEETAPIEDTPIEVPAPTEEITAAA